MKRLTRITEAQTLFDLWPLIEKARDTCVDIGPEWLVAETLSGHIDGYALESETVDGVVFLRKLSGDVCHVVFFVTEPFKAKGWPERVFETIKNFGFKKATAASKRNEKGFEIITGMTPVYTNYEKVL